MSEREFTCPVTTNENDIAVVIAGVERFADTIGMTHKEMLHMQLTVEELLNLQGYVLGSNNGTIVIELLDKTYVVHMKVKCKADDRAKRFLVNTSTLKRNDAYQGFSGKLRQIVDVCTNFEELEDTVGGNCELYGISVNDAITEWSYCHFKEQIKQEKTFDDWDRLECSVLVKLAKDIKVAYTNNVVDIKVTLRRQSF
ncbi:MAG: hypothetical protein HUJ98_07575 [Bacteroidaceae bacterium]|nr:hypothetical protein [Bacteroidaceae bacterium]